MKDFQSETAQRFNPLICAVDFNAFKAAAGRTKALPRELNSSIRDECVSEEQIKQPVGHPASSLIRSQRLRSVRLYGMQHALRDLLLSRP